MRWMLAALLLGLSCVLATAQEDPRRAAVDAAAADAYAALRREVLSTSVGNEQSIGNLVDRCNGRDAMEAFLQTAQQIGGPRWLGEQTVQIRLELPGDQLARVVQKIAEKKTSGLAMPLHILRERLKRDIARRNFAATGSSTSGSAADRLRPDPAQVSWQPVSDDQRREAIDAARRDAIDRTIDSLRTIEVKDVGRLKDALAISAVTANLREWLASRPITSIEFHDDLQVKLALAAPPAAFFPVLRAQIEKQSAMPVPHNVKQWDDLRRAVDRDMRPAVGVALARVPAAPAAMAPKVAMPLEPPTWVADSAMSEAAASGRPGESKLRTARAAEALAVESLRSQVENLALSPDMTLGQAARKDPRIDQAITRSLCQSRIAKVDYDSPEPGAVRIRMTLALDEVWRELAAR